jgi:hypothetical protein
MGSFSESVAEDGGLCWVEAFGYSIKHDSEIVGDELDELEPGDRRCRDLLPRRQIVTQLRIAHPRQFVDQG